MKNIRKSKPGTKQFNADIPIDLFKRIKIDVAELETTKNVWATAALQYFLGSPDRKEIVKDVARASVVVGEVGKFASTSSRKDARGSRGPKTH